MSSGDKFMNNKLDFVKNVQSYKMYFLYFFFFCGIFHLISGQNISVVKTSSKSVFSCGKKM